MNEDIKQALANISEGVCHPLKVRIDEILASDNSPTSLYHATNLLRFYRQIFSQVYDCFIASINNLF